MTETIFSILIGIGLAAAVGFRVFVPLFAISIASHYGVIPLNDNWEWLGSSTAMIILGVATLVELLAYLIPWVDNLLDTITLPLATVAGTIVMLSVVADLDPVINWALAIIAGGGTATTIKASTSTSRLASSTTTGGIANPVVGMFESFVSVILSVLALVAPVLGLIFVLIFLWLIFKVFKWFNTKPLSR